MWTPGVLTSLNCKVILVQVLNHRLFSEHMVSMVQCSMSVILEIKGHMITMSEWVKISEKFSEKCF